MKCVLLVAVSSLIFSPSSFAWGRHDVITEITLDSPEFSVLKTIPIKPESIDEAAPDLLARVIPSLLDWCNHFHIEHDSRVSWTIPAALDSSFTDKEKLLWSLEDNVKAELPVDEEKTAGDILVQYVSEPDGLIDGGLDKSPYIERLQSSMSYFGGNDANTHAFRHYYVPTSLLPPIATPQGIAPYRAALYAKLSEGAFNSGHPYWGYRFLAWSIHYTQDVTQPWHTIFLPGISFLSLSKAKMKHDVSALHYLAEAFSDAWMLKTVRTLASVSIHPLPLLSNPDPWYVASLTESLAKTAHSKALEIANLTRTLFMPVVDQLNSKLKPENAKIAFGGIDFDTAGFDFDGDGRGATAFLSPMWKSEFSLAKSRDDLLKELVTQVNAAIGGSRVIISHVLGNVRAGQLIKFAADPTTGNTVGSPS